ncbi:hypothetical protein HaLaN_15972 [Haematococcus lacustris]|uniref:Uncharacterized protein n=1 Tax=Haematococcus lacustris TaxID=44745 RepID=A0A699ZCC7_HAELA|nr:hypothetical protein HaLaN_15972 [Haematococcus lacustris]
MESALEELELVACCNTVLAAVGIASRTKTEQDVLQTAGKTSFLAHAVEFLLGRQLGVVSSGTSNEQAGHIQSASAELNADQRPVKTFTPQPFPHLRETHRQRQPRRCCLHPGAACSPVRACAEEAAAHSQAPPPRSCAAPLPTLCRPLGALLSPRHQPP